MDSIFSFNVYDYWHAAFCPSTFLFVVVLFHIADLPALVDVFMRT